VIDVLDAAFSQAYPSMSDPAFAAACCKILQLGLSP
jgi:hypothetical protein